MTRELARHVKPIFLAMALLFAFSSVVFAKGSDVVSPFPVIDARAGIQRANAMATDSAGNIIVVGYSYNGTDNDYMLVKFKADGTGMAWGGPVYFSGTAADEVTAVAVDSADNIIVTGTTWNGTNNDIRTIKYNGATGAEIWGHTYNSGGADTATSIAVDGSNNIYVAGYAFNGTSRDDFLIIKYPSAGATPTWVELYDDTSYPNTDNRILAIATGSDGIAVTGYSLKVTSGSDFDILTRKYGFDKTLVREWRHASTGTGDDRGIAVKMDSSGYVIVTGFVANASNNTDIYTVKYNPASSTPVWEKTYDGDGNDEPKALWVDSSGNVYVTGFTTTLAGNQDFFTARYAGSDGTLVWKSIFDDGNGATDIPVGIVVDNAADGGVFVTGYTTVSGNEDYMTLKYRKDNGNLLWEKSWNGPGNNNDRPVGIALEPATAPNPRNVIVAGWTYGATNSYDFAAIKYDFGALNAPSDLTATAASNTSITLTWVDNSSNEDKFVIQRKLGEAGTFADITTTPSPLPANTVTYTDTDLTANNYYYYRVRAYNAANGDSYYSNEARALTKVVSYDTPVWTYLYNGADKDKATAITVGSDDNPVVTGYSVLREVELDPGSTTYDYMTIKLDRSDSSKIKWKARYDSEDGGDDQAEGVVLDSNGNALVTGTAYLAGSAPPYGKSDELYSLKYNTATYSDPAGTTTPPVLWADQYGTQNGIDKATAIEMAQDASNNSVVIGYGGSASADTNIFIIKYAADGTRSWTPIVYDSGRNDFPTGLALDSSGDIFVTGYSYDKTADPTGSYDWFTAKYSGATGAPIWSDTYNVSKDNFGGVDRNDQAFSIDVDSAGNAYVTGYATNSSNNTVFYTVKYDGKSVPTGNRRIWEKSFNYSGYDADAVWVKIDPIDGAVVVGGSAYVSATDSDFHLIRYNSLDGSVVWDRNFDKPDSYDYATAMTLDSSGYIYLAGNSRGGPDTNAAFDSTSDIMSLIYDYAGTFQGASKFDGAAHKQDEAVAIAVNYQGEAFIAGFSTNVSDNTDYAVVKHKNNYILVPAPLTLTPKADYTKIDLAWSANTSGTSFRIERTPGPSTPLSTWALIASPASGTTTYTDTSLSSGTNYCYRIDAISGSLNSRKIEKCATTTLPAPTLSPLTVDSSTQVTLNWSQVAGNTGYKVERKTTAGGTWGDLTTKTAGQNSHVDTGLTPGTIYYYRISTFNSGGYSVASNELSATTIPAAPVLNAASNITTTQVTLTWSDVDGEAGYSIERKTGAGGSWAEIATKGAGVLTITDTVTSNTQYYYRVRAYNNSPTLYSAYSGEQGALTLFDSPTLSSATASSATQIDLTWTNVAGETSYSVQESVCVYNNNANDYYYCTAGYLNNTSYWSAWTTIATPAADVVTYPRTGRTSGYAYAYRIIANTTVPVANVSAPSNAIIAWTYMTAPVLTITPASETSLTPSWTNINAATNYTLERKLGSGGTFAEVTGAIAMTYSATGYTDTGLSLSTEYCYRVRAYSTLPNPPPSIYSNELCKFTPLAAPVLNDPVVVSTTQINLSWANVPGNTGYEILRCNTNYPNNPEYLATYGNNSANDSWFWTCSSVIVLPQDTVSYSDTGRLPGYTYRYKIRDNYSGGTSAYSTPPKDTITMPSAPTLSATAASTTQMNLSWNDVNGETSFKLEWKARSGADCTAGSWSAPITIAENTTTYSHTGLTAATFYCYRIYAYNSYSQSAYSNELAQTTQLSPPTLNTPSGVTVSNITLTWNNVTGNTGYKIERKTDLAGAWGQVGTVGQDVVTFSNNSGLSAGTLYYYRVSVQNAGGYSLPSNEQSTTTTPGATPTLTRTVISADEIDLSWLVVLGATNYKVERSEDNVTWSEIANVSATYSQTYCGESYPTAGCPTATNAAASYQNTGLTEKTLYYYRVRSWNSTGGDSVYSTVVSGTTSAMPEQALTATPLDGGFMIKLEWTPSVCVLCDAPTGYEIQRQVKNGNWVYKILDGSTLTYTDGVAIEPGKKYRYRVRSLNGADKSSFSEVTVFAKPYSAAANVCTVTAGGRTWTPWIPEVVATPVPSPVLSAPSAPTGISSATGNAQVTITWTAGTGSASSLIRYGNATGVYTTTLNPSVSPRTITGLTNNTTYYYQVGAINGVGTTWSAQYSATPTSSAPSAATGISSTPGSAQAIITWTAGSGSTSSSIRYGTASGVYTTTLNPSASPKTVTGLTNSTTYYYQVGAINGSGTTWSAEYSVTPVGVPVAPTGISATPGNTQMTITWTAGTGATSSLIKYGTVSNTYTTTVDPAVSPKTITGLTNSTKYYYQVGAKNASGTTWNTTEYNVTPLAAAPSNATGISSTPGNGQATITWTAGATSTSSSIRYGTATGVYTTNLTPSVSPKTINNLTNGTTYYYQVGAINASGTTWNTTEYSLTPTSSAPSAATGISSTAGIAEATISWTAGTGSTTSSIRYGTASGVYTTTLNPVVSPNTITGLTRSTTYYYQVGANNGSGTTWSDEYSVTTLGIRQQANWASQYAAAAYPAGAVNANYTIASGTNRLLVVAIASTRTTVGTQTVSVTYGGKALTLAAGDGTSAATWNHSYLYYLNEADIQAAAGTSLNVTVTGGTQYYTYVYAAVYSGVDQTTPFTDAKSYNSATADTAVGPFSPTLTIALNDQAIEIVNLAGNVASTTARTISAWATGWTTAGVAPASIATNGPTATLYIRDRNVLTAAGDGSQHTATANTWDSMTAMSIKCKQ